MAHKFTSHLLTAFATILVVDCFTWTKYPDSITRVWNGSTVALQWDYNLTSEEQNAAKIVITRLWTRGNESHQVLIASNSFIISSPPVRYNEGLKPHITISRSEEATLTINDVTKEDEGFYKFRLGLLTLNNFLISRNTTLEVRGKLVQPTLQCPKTLNATKGKPFNISCSVTGDPEPNITWTKESQTGNVISYTLTFVIDNVSISDGGIYNVTAYNGRSASVLVVLKVLFKPENVQLTTSATNNKACRGDVISFGCTADGSPSVTSYQLFENDSAILDTNTLGKWSRNLTSEGVFIYKCVANNTLGSAYSTSVTVTVNVPSSIQAIDDKAVTEGDNVTLSCHASGIPPPMVSWIKAGGQRVNGSVLMLTNINRSEAGEYRCEASNECGNATETANVDVQYRPLNVSLTTNVTNKVCAGITVRFTCSADANPPVHTFFLYENNASIGRMENVGTFIKKIESIGHFVFRCEVNNSVQGLSRSGDTMLIVNDPPFVQHEERKFVKEGENISVYCNVTGIPSPTVSWTRVKSDGDVVKGNSLNISNISRCQAGEYRCTARNPCGTESTTVDIDVQYPPYVVSREQHVVTEGHCAFLSCPVLGNPPPNIMWYKGNDTSAILTRKSTLEFPLTSVNVSGWYTCLAKNYIGNVTTSVFLQIEKSVQSTPTTSSITTSKASEGIEVYVTATINESCSRRLEVAAEFPDVACEIAFRFGCVSANTVNSRCGSVVVDFIINFNQSVVVTDVLASLKDAARQDKFGVFKVDPASIKQVSLPNGGSYSTAQVPKECKCSCNDVILTAIIGVLVFIIVILLLYIVWLHKKGTKEKTRKFEYETSVYDNEMALEDLEPSRPDSSQFTQPRAEYMDLKEATIDNTKPQSAGQAADYAPLHPLTRSWEVVRDDVTIEKIIGKGAFGQVAKGIAVELRGRPGTTTVAIKMLKDNAAESDKRDLMKELNTMKQLKPHRHVIKLLGCVTESEPLLVLIEYVPFGDLLGYLRKSRGLNDTYYKDPDIKPQTNLTSQQLMKFAWQIADGMSYLSSKSIIHRDLAARNVLVGEKETCKVTDFGMARHVQQENIYERKTKGRLPVKWTAYEALLYGTYTTKSDIWSYGVVLYEIFTIGGSPYPRMDGRKIANLLQEGYRMPKPQHVDDKLYQIMMSCWQDDPDARPTFTDLKTQLKDMESLHKRLINMKMYDKQLYANVEDLVV